MFVHLRLMMENAAKECGEQSALRDMLTDLRHIAHERGLDFDMAVEGSGEVFYEEAATSTHPEH